MFNVCIKNQTMPANKPAAYQILLLLPLLHTVYKNSYTVSIKIQLLRKQGGVYILCKRCLPY